LDSSSGWEEQRGFNLDAQANRGNGELAPTCAVRNWPPGQAAFAKLREANTGTRPGEDE